MGHLVQDKNSLYFFAEGSKEIINSPHLLSAPYWPALGEMSSMHFSVDLRQSPLRNMYYSDFSVFEVRKLRIRKGKELAQSNHAPC